MNNSRGGTDCSYAGNQFIGYNITTGKPDGNNYELHPLSKTKFYYHEHECIHAEFIINQDNTITLKIQNASRIFERKKWG